MVYDNIWWSALFAITCGGLPGLDGSSPPHHVDALSEQERRSKCESWQNCDIHPEDVSKTKAIGDRERGRNYAILEWASIAFSLALWIGFCIYFLMTLRPAVDFTAYATKWPRGATWYLISCGPAVVGAIFELLQNRVDLFEPASPHPDETRRRDNFELKPGFLPSPQAVSGPGYRLVEPRNVFNLWI